MLHPVQDEGAAIPLLCNTRSIVIRITLDYLIQANCELTEISEAISVQISGILVWKGFPYTRVLTKL